MADLEHELRALGADLAYPATPDLAMAVRERLAAEPGPARPAAAVPERRAAKRGPVRSRRRWVVSRRAVVLALVALLLLAAAALAAVPAVRERVLEVVGLRGATVERRHAPALPAAREQLRLGRPVTLAQARAALRFDPLVPALLGAPDAVRIRGGVPGGELSLLYEDRPGLPRAPATGAGLLVTEFRGDLAPGYVGKVAPAAARVERLRVAGDRAVWIEGAGHGFSYRSPGGGVRDRDLRLAANVLLLERGRLLVRLEGAFGRERALALARSLRGARRVP